MKWDFFARKLRPLADDCAARVREGLFAGVVRPFHYVKAKGWMRDIFRTVLSAPEWLTRWHYDDAEMTPPSRRRAWHP